jgi:hypothetical protein
MEDSKAVPVGQAVSQETALPIRPVKSVQLGQAVEVETAQALSVLMRTHLWISWARIALKHEATARAIRQAMEQPSTPTGVRYLAGQGAGPGSGRGRPPSIMVLCEQPTIRRWPLATA